MREGDEESSRSEDAYPVSIVLKRLSSVSSSVLQLRTGDHLLGRSQELTDF